MGLEDVKKEILKQAENTAQQQLEEAEEEADRILAEAEDEAEEIREDIIEDAEEQVDQIRRQKIASARMDAKKQKLAAKQDVMDEAYDQLRERVHDLDHDRKVELISSVLDTLAGQHDIGHVHVPHGFKKDVKGLTDATVSIRDDLEDGVIVEDSSGEMSFNYSFSTVLETIQKENRQELANTLF